MAISLLVNGLAYLIQSQANSLPVFAIAMAISGAFNPLYRVGADAMMADLIPSERRADAYSLLRTSNNLGVAMGPAIGGALVATSYTTAFYIAASGMILFAPRSCSSSVARANAFWSPEMTICPGEL